MYNMYPIADKTPSKTSKIFELFFILYTVAVYCFNDQAEFLPYVYATYAGIIGFVLLKILFDVKKVVFFKENVTLLLYGIFCKATTLWAISTPLADSRANTVLFFIAFAFFCTFYFTDIKNVDLILKALTIAGVILSLYAIISYGGFSSFYYQATQENARIGSEVGQTNSIGMRCAYTVVLLFYYSIYKKKFILFPVAILPFVVSMASGSRKAIFIVALGVAILLFFSQDDKCGSAAKWGKLLLIGIVSILACWAILQLPIMNTVTHRLEQMFATFSGGDGDNSSYVRLELTKAGWKQFKSSPLVGVGAGNSFFVMRERVGLFAYSHNDYIEQLVNGGIVGFGLYFGLLFSLLASHIKLLNERNPETIISFTLLVVFLINSFGAVGYYNKITYIYIALWISVVKINRDKKEKINEYIKENTLVRNNKNRTKYPKDSVN